MPRKSAVRNKVLDDVRRLVASGELPVERVLNEIVDGLMDIKDELSGSREPYDRDVLTNIKPLLAYLTKVTNRIERWRRDEVRDL